MSKTSTTDNLILYYFNETAMAETVLVQNAIDIDVVVRDEYEEIKSTFDILDECIATPRQSSIEAIMNYSKLVANLS
jgi:hypothetical protein